MNDFEFDVEYEDAIPSFATVGGLRELLKNYPDNTPISICGLSGLFYPHREQQRILLETQDSSGYESLHEIMMDSEVFNTDGEGYMDF